jgi:hypothetical protein
VRALLHDDLRTLIKSIRSVDAKLAALTLTPFMRATILRMCRQTRGDNASAMFAAVVDVEEWVKR